MKHLTRFWIVTQLERASEHIQLNNGDIGKRGAFEIKRMIDSVLLVLEKEREEKAEEGAK